MTLTPIAKAQARQQYHIDRNRFTVILVGKDGGEKLRVYTPLTVERLNGIVDAMPMRREEMREHR